MKTFFKISGTHGYPDGLILHMIKVTNASHFQLNYFYDANIPSLWKEQLKGRAPDVKKKN